MEENYRGHSHSMSIDRRPLHSREEHQPTFQQEHVLILSTCPAGQDLYSAEILTRSANASSRARPTTHKRFNLLLLYESGFLARMLS